MSTKSFAALLSSVQLELSVQQKRKIAFPRIELLIQLHDDAEKNSSDFNATINRFINFFRRRQPMNYFII